VLGDALLDSLSALFNFSLLWVILRAKDSKKDESFRQLLLIVSVNDFIKCFNPWPAYILLRLRRTIPLLGALYLQTPFIIALNNSSTMTFMLSLDRLLGTVAPVWYRARGERVPLYTKTLSTVSLVFSIAIFVFTGYSEALQQPSDM
jgi:hypothetical protein